MKLYILVDLAEGTKCFFLLPYGIDAAMQYCANNVDWKSDINLSIYAKDNQTQPSKRETNA
jgi:hypothetical protein